jgi:hypothetical protein
MVKDSGTAIRAHRLRPLAGPRDLHVETDEAGAPLRVLFEGVLREVASVQDRWRIDDEWWRETPLSRMYYQLRLEGDRVVTVYEDLVGGAWCVQRY